MAFANVLLSVNASWVFSLSCYWNFVPNSLLWYSLSFLLPELGVWDSNRSTAGKTKRKMRSFPHVHTHTWEHEIHLCLRSSHSMPFSTALSCLELKGLLIAYLLMFLNIHRSLVWVAARLVLFPSWKAKGTMMLSPVWKIGSAFTEQSRMPYVGSSLASQSLLFPFPAKKKQPQSGKL